jgi:hypothetical protein
MSLAKASKQRFNTSCIYHLLKVCIDIELKTKNYKMCDTYCKRRTAEQLASPSKKIKVSQVDEQATTSSEQNVTQQKRKIATVC